MKRFAATMIGMTGRTWMKKDAFGNMRVINTTAGIVVAKQPKKVMHTSAAFAIQRIIMIVRFIVLIAQSTTFSGCEPDRVSSTELGVVGLGTIKPIMSVCPQPQ